MVTLGAKWSPYLLLTYFELHVQNILFLMNLHICELGLNGLTNWRYGVLLHNKKGKCKPFIISKLWIKNRALLPTFHINKSNCLHNTHAVLCGAHVSTRILFGNPFNNKFTVSVDTVKVGWEKQVREQHKCLSVTWGNNHNSSTFCRLDLCVSQQLHPRAHHDLGEESLSHRSLPLGYLLCL